MGDGIATVTSSLLLGIGKLGAGRSEPHRSCNLSSGHDSPARQVALRPTGHRNVVVIFFSRTKKHSQLTDKIGRMAKPKNERGISRAVMEKT